MRKNFRSARYTRKHVSVQTIRRQMKTTNAHASARINCLDMLEPKIRSSSFCLTTTECVIFCLQFRNVQLYSFEHSKSMHVAHILRFFLFGLFIRINIMMIFQFFLSIYYCSKYLSLLQLLSTIFENLFQYCQQLQLRDEESTKKLHGQTEPTSLKF